MAVKNPKAETKTDAVVSAGFSAYIGPSIVGVVQTATIFPVGRADALNLPVSTVKSHVRRGLAAMKKRSEES